MMNDRGSRIEEEQHSNKTKEKIRHKERQTGMICSIQEVFKCIQVPRKSPLDYSQDFVRSSGRIRRWLIRRSYSSTNNNNDTVGYKYNNRPATATNSDKNQEADFYISRFPTPTPHSHRQAETTETPFRSFH